MVMCIFNHFFSILWKIYLFFLNHLFLLPFMTVIGLYFENDCVGTCVLQHGNISHCKTHYSLSSVCHTVLSQWKQWSSRFRVVHNNDEKWAQLLLLCKTWPYQEQRNFFNAMDSPCLYYPERVKLNAHNMAYQLCVSTVKQSRFQKAGKLLGIAIVAYVIFKL